MCGDKKMNMIPAYCTQFTDRECKEEDCCLGTVCQKCNVHGKDRRTLWMACFYDMNELNIPFKLEIITDEKEREGMAKLKHHFYTLRVCKGCRADWMAAIQLWWQIAPTGNDACGSGIFIRELGETIEVT